MILTYLLTENDDLRAQITAFDWVMVLNDLHDLHYDEHQAILLDEDWPERDAILAEHSKQHIIMLMNDDDHARIAAYMDAGASDYLPKGLICAMLSTRLQKRVDVHTVDGILNTMRFDVNGMLSNISGFSAFLTRPDLSKQLTDETKQGYLQNIAGSGQRAAQHMIDYRHAYSVMLGLGNFDNSYIVDLREKLEGMVSSVSAMSKMHTEIRLRISDKLPDVRTNYQYLLSAIRVIAPNPFYSSQQIKTNHKVSLVFHKMSLMICRELL